MDTVVSRFTEGGIFMYVILAFAVLTVSLIIERAIALYVKVKEPAPDFREKILGFLAKGDLSAAHSLAQEEAGNSSVGRIVKVGCEIRAKGGGEEQLQSRMDESLSEEIAIVDKRTGFLSMLGNVSMLLGLLGTVSGMIKSFAAVADASPANRALLLSKGISEAMNTTAFGLTVAIPALVAYAVYQNQIDRLVGKMTKATTEIYHDLLFLTESKVKA